jgi:HemY protein
MIRAIFWAGVLLALLVAVLLAARFDRGYVLIVFPPWRVEMSFVLLLAVTFGLYLLTYAAFKLLRVALRLPAEVRIRRERRLRERSADDTSRALAALLSGQHAHARHLADLARHHDKSPLVALVAALAATELGDADAAQAYLDGVTGNDVGELTAARQAIAARLAALAAPADNQAD